MSNILSWKADAPLWPVFLVVVWMAMLFKHYSTKQARRKAIVDQSGRQLRSIPGPPQLPIIGNIGQVNPVRQHPQFLQWAKQYGEIFQLRFGNNKFVVLNSAKATVELLDRRSGIYSSRAGPHFAHDLMSQGQRMVFLDYGKEWKACRAALHPHLMGTKSVQYRSVQEQESAILIRDLLCYTRQKDKTSWPNQDTLTHESSWEAWVRRYTTSVVMSITYGHRIQSAENNQDLHKIYDVLATFTKVGQPGSWLCDDFPIVRMLPNFLAPWRKKGLDLHKWEMELWGGFLNRIKAEREESRETPCFASHALENRATKAPDYNGEGFGLDSGGNMSDILLAYTAATVLEAGSDTTASSVYFFVLACLNQPEVLRKLQAEIDSRVDRTRLPVFDDLQGLPYLHGCVKEVLRRRPPTIMGIPHKVTQDDVYDGYFIEKDTVVIGNVWAIHNDPKRYPEPEKFMPERFAEDKLSSAESAATLDPERRDHFAFGWGRRVCQGMHIADGSLHIIFARLAWAFDILPIKKEQVYSIDDEETFMDGFVSQTKAFNARFVPRDDKVAKVLDSGFEEAQTFWSSLGTEGDVRNADWTTS
ncbi:unnamed protein product [Tilletia controversa]|uniref:Cytochrome P450 n=1 Tax=Tilletia controversa TaxID=13291 RepID=A0A8X7MS38_9BASI|nr:hypothetical protein CF328_g3228 [Tilletia controversa]KAE8247309.1 hypothetical protein A4X06_0g4544 [Tilletia controversa]CAD6912244.1 unnamed protein product [Tilletia controversa]CAD6925683.1 unnamed protein product [Tilletia controversa]CAD6939901.1 unnamed protein product [Tilletia controversa]